MRDDRSSFLRSKAKTARATSNLPLSATALRCVVNAGVRAFKVGTVESIIDTIIEVLPGKDGALIQPLLEDLPKALKGVLEYQPHVERLPQVCWDAAVDFCLKSLSSFLVEADTEAENSWSTGASPRSRSRTRTPFEFGDSNTPKHSSRDAVVRKSIPDAFVQTAEDFVHCLQFLTKASNAPVLGKSDQILTTLIQFLQRKTGRGQSAALAAVNSVLSRVSLYSTQLAKRTIQDLLPLMRLMWSESSLRGEILIALMVTENHLASILSEKHADATSFDLEALVEIMYGEYRRRQESSIMQFLEDDHLCFRHMGRVQADTHPLATHAFSMETEHVRGESLWATVSIIARLSYMLDKRKRVFGQDKDGRDELPNKRARSTQHFQDYLRHVSEPKSNAKRAALQVVAFMLQEGPVDEEDLQSTLDKLTVYITDENPVHSSWAMIALTA
jgi:ataxia telangiectasia mutated family protein